MKKVLLTLALTAVCAASFAQGKVNMNNDATRAVTFGAQVKAGDTTGAAASQVNGSGSVLLVDLFGGATAGTMTLQQTTTMGPVAGIFGPRTFTAVGVNGGVDSFWQVKVRENTFTTAELAQAGGGYFGASPVFTFRASSTIAFNAINNTGGTALSTWAAGPLVINAIPIPEPSSMALAGIGAASLLIFRRRK